MALTFTKFNCLANDVMIGVHDFQTHTVKAALTNTAPIASQTVFEPVTLHPPPADVNGYTAGGHDTTNVCSAGKVTCTDITITATAGGIGPFRYIILYNDTSATDALIAFYDYASSITLANVGDNIVLDFDPTAGVLVGTVT